MRQNILLQAENQIQLLQAQMDSSPSDVLCNALFNAKSVLHNLLPAEEAHRRKKSRIKWLAEGSRNTKFFHLSAKICGCANSIDCISYNRSKTLLSNSSPPHSWPPPPPSMRSYLTVLTLRSQPNKTNFSLLSQMPKRSRMLSSLLVTSMPPH